MNAPRFALLMFLSASLFAGCTVTQTVETVILDTQLSGPTTQIPVHLTTPRTPHTTTISPYWSIGPAKPFAGSVKGQEMTYAQPSTLGGESPYSLHWSVPSAVMGLDVDLAGEETAVSFGGHVASTDEDAQWGVTASVGTFSAHEGNVAVRFDVGLSFAGISQRTFSRVITTTESDFVWSHSTTVDTAFYFDSSTENHFGYFAAMTLNSFDTGIPVDFALQAAFHRQTLFSFEPRTQVQSQWLVPMPVVIRTRSSGGDATTAVSFISLAPAIATEFSGKMRVVAGARILWPVSENISIPKTVVLPFLRVDLTIR